MDLFIRGCA